MSDGARVQATVARRVAEGVAIGMVDLCRSEHVVVAGSLRRGTPTVGDIEIVALPDDAPQLLARLDRWVATGEARKAVYSDGSTRWGSKYRGLIIDGLRVEVFLADADNWGYILWLRTGPGDANTYVMQRLHAQRAPYLPVEGYWQHDGRRIAVPDEGELFRLLGSEQVIAPKDRTMLRYATLFQPVGRAHQWASEWTWAEAVEAPPVQGSMF